MKKVLHWSREGKSLEISLLDIEIDVWIRLKWSIKLWAKWACVAVLLAVETVCRICQIQKTVFIISDAFCIRYCLLKTAVLIFTTARKKQWLTDSIWTSKFCSKLSEHERLINSTSPESSNLYNHEYFSSIIRTFLVGSSLSDFLTLHFWLVQGCVF